MIGLDTNVLVRLAVNDDAGQVMLAGRLLDELATHGPGYISTAVMMELCWVLTSHYRYTRDQVANALSAVLETREFQIERAEALSRAVGIFRQTRANFADCVIACVATAAGCTYTATFDVGASKLPGMQLLR